MSKKLSTNSTKQQKVMKPVSDKRARDAPPPQPSGPTIMPGIVGPPPVVSVSVSVNTQEGIPEAKKKKVESLH